MKLSKAFSLPCLCFFSLFYTLSFSQQQTSPVANNGDKRTDVGWYIENLDAHIRENKKVTSQLTKNDLADLPIGIVREIGNYQCIIAIDSAYWDGKGWFFNAYASIKFPGTSTPLAFSGRRIGFNEGGLASLSQTKLTLAVPLKTGFGDNVVMELPADGSNYLEIDCAGFKSMKLTGKFHFTDRIEPVADSLEDVSASFSTDILDVHNFMTTVKIDPFKIKGVDDIIFDVKNAVVDYSDYANPPGLTFPADYQQSFGDLPNLWRGFYLGKVDIKFKPFTKEKTKEGDKKWLTIQGSNVLIDGDGITGKGSGLNVLALDKGAVERWGISIDSISINVLHNHITGGSLAGYLKIPFLGKDSLAYSGKISIEGRELNYKVLVKTVKGKEYPTPFANGDEVGVSIKINEGSTIALEKKDGEFTASAVLNGAFFINGGSLSGKGIEFQNLTLMSRAPYIKSPDFSLGVMDPKAAGFPFQLDKINLKTSEEGKITLGFGAKLNLMDADSQGFSADAQFLLSIKEKPGSAVSTGVDTNARQEWQFDGFTIAASIDCRTSAIAVKGKLAVFINDPTYGRGLHGSVSMSVQGVVEGMTANVYYGNSHGSTNKSGNDFRYWHADLYIPIAGTGIPLPPGLLSLRGLIGGASYKMTPKNLAPDFAKLSITAQTTQAPEASSSVEYVPDATAGISVNLGATLALTSNPNAFNADAEITLAFNENRGLRYVQFKASGYFMTSIEDRRKSGASKVPLYADLNCMYDHVNSVFHANMKAYLNLEGELRGTGANNMAGEMVMHFDKGEKYIWIGRPGQMLGVDIIGIAGAQFYFMAGNKLENPPPLPPEMRDLVNTAGDLQVKDQNALDAARGFMIGARFQTGVDFHPGPFHVALSIGAGADLMLRNFGDAVCEGSTSHIGFSNGWYASGQAYVFLRGKVSIMSFDILNLGAAAILSFKTPNPSWLKGQLACRYSVMGGFVKGTFNKEFTVGKNCEIVMQGSELGEIHVVQDITPGGNDVSVFTSPQVSFNTSVETEFSTMNASNETNSYRIKLDKFSMITSDGKTIPAAYEWNDKKDVLALRLSETLPQKTTITASVKVHWEKKLSNGSWVVLKDNKDLLTYEEKAMTFTTGEAPSFIPDENVVYSYPVKHQYNFLVNEYGQGYVKLRVGQSYLFQPSDDGTKWTYLARFQQPSGSSAEVPLSYDADRFIVNFSIPPTLDKQAVYKLTFVKRPETQASMDANVNRTSVNVSGVGEGNEVSVASNTLEGSLTQKIDKEIYGSAFRTSRFATFNEKWSTLSETRNLFDVAIGNVAVIGKGAVLQETFDEFELNGVRNHHKALVQVSASPDDDWMANNMAPRLYNAYPIDPSITITHRNPDSLGVKPLRAVRLYNLQEDYLLGDDNISSGVAPTRNGPVKVLYFLSWIGYRDFDELRNKAAYQVLSGKSSASISRLLSYTGYTDLTPGTYKINFSYTLPGINRVTSEKQLEIQF